MTAVTLETQLKPFILFILIISFWSLNIIYSKVNASIGSKKEVQAFRGMLISFMVYTLVDLRLIVGDAFYTALPRLLVCFIISVGFASMSFSCFFWFLHVYANLHNKKTTKFINTSLDATILWMHLPLFVVVAILFTPLHVIVYDLKDNLPVFGPGLMIILLMDYIYLIAATAISIHNWRRSKTTLEKKKYRSQFIFILFFTVNGILIAFLLNLPAIELSVIPVVLKLFVELQDSQIYTDALTKLYNRRRMKDFITEEMANCSEEDPLAVIMLDLDYFKSINDILGHDEGDRVLTAFAGALKKVLASRNAVAARWGGDEFVVAGKDANLVPNIRELLEAALRSNSDLDYIPRFSVGSYYCTSSDISYAQLLINADESLYVDKRERHEATNDFVAELQAIKNRR